MDSLKIMLEPHTTSEREFLQLLHKKEFNQDPLESATRSLSLLWAETQNLKMEYLLKCSASGYSIHLTLDFDSFRDF